GGPGIRGDFVLAPAGIAAGLLIHFEEDEVRESALAKAPRGAQASNSSTNNNNGKFFDALRSRKTGAVAQEVAHLEGIVDERAFDLWFTLEGKTDERRAAGTEKFSAAKLQ